MLLCTDVFKLEFGMERSFSTVVDVHVQIGLIQGCSLSILNDATDLVVLIWLKIKINDPKSEQSQPSIGFVPLWSFSGIRSFVCKT